MFRLLIYIFLTFVLATLVINAYVFSFSRQYILSGSVSSSTPFALAGAASSASSANIANTPPAAGEPFPVAIVLGASVYSNGILSPLLEARAKTGLELYRRGLVRKILVSGDNHLTSYNEVMPIRTYLLAAGVPPEDIFTDFAGFNTYDSMYRAQAIFGVHEALIVSQSFHLPRAIFVARKLGLNAYGVPVDTNSSGGGLGNNLRELGATVKTFFEVESGTKPYFLGRQIPISGDGRGSLR